MQMKVKNLAYRSVQEVLKVASHALDWTPPKILSGPGSVKKLPELVRRIGFDNVLVVTDKDLMRLGLLDGLLEGLHKEGIKYSLFDGAQINPTIHNIEEGRKLYIANKCQAIIGFGGGSPMDCAKAIGARIARPNLPVQKMKGLLRVIVKIPTFFAVPTTAGSGSETTICSVVTNSETNEKYAINDNTLIPDYAILDPELTIGLPPKITAMTGLDALTHAVEAFIGRSNTRKTEEYAKKSVCLFFDNMLTAYEKGKNLEARENMLLCAYCGGAAFTRAYVGYSHAIAHALGGLYNCQHGLTNAVILPRLLDFYGETIHDRLAILADEAGIGKDLSSKEDKAEAFISEIKKYNKLMSIPEKFDFIEEDDIDTIVKRVLKEANPFYPVPVIMDEDSCEDFVRSLMDED